MYAYAEHTTVATKVVNLSHRIRKKFQKDFNNMPTYLRCIAFQRWNGFLPHFSVFLPQKHTLGV